MEFFMVFILELNGYSDAIRGAVPALTPFLRKPLVKTRIKLS